MSRLRTWLAKKKETLFKERIAPHLERLPNTWFVKIQQRAIRGTPDILLCVNGIFVALELKKSDKEKRDLLQDHNLDKINKSGGLGIKTTPGNWLAVLEALTILSKGGICDRDKLLGS
jgi:hypothetical protein